MQFTCSCAEENSGNSHEFTDYHNLSETKAKKPDANPCLKAAYDPAKGDGQRRISDERPSWLFTSRESDFPCFTKCTK